MQSPQASVAKRALASLQWRRTLEPTQRQASSANIQRHLTAQRTWMHVVTWPFFQTYRRATVKNLPFAKQTLLGLKTTCLDK